MLIADYNYELDMEVQREEAREEGFEEGRQEGREEMILKVYSDGKTIAEIANFLGEPVEEIEKIINSCEWRR